MAATSQSYEKLEDEALHLPLQDRSRLAKRLLDSLDDEEEVSDEWLEELRRRTASIDDGTARLIPHGEVMAKLRNLIGQVRK